MAERKRIVALFLAILMIVQMLPVNALAEVGRAGWNLMMSTYDGVESTLVTFEVAKTAADGKVTEYKELTTQLVVGSAAPIYPDIPDFEGYTADYSSWAYAETRTLEDGTTTKVHRPIYVPVEKRTVTVKFVYSDGTAADTEQVYEYDASKADQSLTISVKSLQEQGFDMTKTTVTDEKGANVALTSSESGYSFTVNVSALTEDKVYTVKYIGAVTWYTVNHRKQNIDNTNYTVAETETIRNVNVGTMTTAAAKSEWTTGFTVQEFSQQPVAVNGGTVIKIDYNRNSYTLTYNTGSNATYVDSAILPYEKVVTLPAVTRKGYTFEQWKAIWTDADGKEQTELLAENATTYTMPAHDVTLEAQWVQDQTANYTIVYWKESVPTTVGEDAMGADWIYESSEVKSAKIGETVGDDATEYTAKNYKGFKTTPYDVEEVEVKADGSSVLNVYYERDVFTITFYKLKQSLFGGYSRGDALPSLTIQAKYEVDVSSVWENDAHRKYTWMNPKTNDWYTLFANMPAENLEMWGTDRTGSQVVIYYVESLTAGQYMIYQIVGNNSFSYLTVEDQQPIRGFSYSSWMKNAGSFKGEATVAGYGYQADSNKDYNGAWLKYTRNSYKLDFQNCTTSTTLPSLSTTLKFEQVIDLSEIVPNKPDGMEDEYEFGGWYYDAAFEKPVRNGVDKMDADNTQVFAKWNPKQKTVKFYWNYTGATEPYGQPYVVFYKDTLSAHHNNNGEYDENHNGSYTLPAEPTREGYTFGGWFTDEACTMPLTHTTDENGKADYTPFLSVTIAKDWEIYAKWVSDEDEEATMTAAVKGGANITTYEKADGSIGYVADLMPEAKGPVGTTITLEAPEIPGYACVTKYKTHTFVEGDNTILFEYVELDTWSMTINYVDEKGNPITFNVDANGKPIDYVDENGKTIQGQETLANIEETQRSVEYKVLPNGTENGKEYMWHLTSEPILTATKDKPTVTFTYEKVCKFAYTVEYYFQDANTGEYAKNEKLKPTENGYMWTGFTLTKSPDAQIGYYKLSTSEPEATTTGQVSIIIKKDEESNIIKVYYDLKTANYTVEHYQMDTDGKYPTTPTETETALEGRIGQTVTATSKAYTGFTLDETAEGYKASGEVTADGKLVLKLYYERPTHTYTELHVYDGQTETKVNAAVKYFGETVTSQKVDKTGFTYRSVSINPATAGTTGEDTATVTMPHDSDVTVTYVYTRNSHDVSYSYTGTVPSGAPAAPAPVTKVPYGAEKQVEAAPTFAGYDFSGWKTDDVTVNNDGTFSMPDNKVEFTGSWTARNDTKYTVEFYYQYKNEDGELVYPAADDESVVRDERTGKTGTTANVTENDKANKQNNMYVYDLAAANVESGTIVGDGSLVLKLYFKLNTGSLTINKTLYGGKNDGTEKFTFNITGPNNYKNTVELTIGSNGTATTTISDLLIGEYTVSEVSKAPEYLPLGADSQNATVKPAENTPVQFNNTATRDITVTKTWLDSNNAEVTDAADKTDAGITLYADGEEKDSYTATAQNPSKTFENLPTHKLVDNTISAIVYTIDETTVSEGYSKISAALNGDVGTVQNKKNIYSYVVHHLEEGTTTPTLADDTTGSAEFGSLIDVSELAKNIEGFTYKNETGDIRIAVYGNEATIYYTRNSYDVTYAYEAGSQATDVALPTGNTDVLFDAEVDIADDLSKPGYTFTGWHTAEDDKFKVADDAKSFKMPAQDVTLYGKFTANENTPYKIEYYQQQLDGTYAIVAGDTKNLTGKTDTAVNLDGKINTYTGFTYVESKTEYVSRATQNGETVDTVTKNNIHGDGSLVVKLYYDRKTDYSYTVNYYWIGTTEAVLESVTRTDKKFGETYTEPVVQVDGYTPETNKVKSVTIQDGTNEITFYYYKNVTLTAKTDSYLYNGQEQTLTGYTPSIEGVTFAETVQASGKGTDVKEGGYPVTFTGVTENETLDTTGKYIVTDLVEGKLTITKRTVHMVSATASKPYDGNALKAESVDDEHEGYDGFVKGEGAEYSVTGTQTEIGQSDNSFSYDLNDNTKLTNYTITTANGKLTVTGIEVKYYTKNATQSEFVEVTEDYIPSYGLAGDSTINVATFQAMVNYPGYVPADPAYAYNGTDLVVDPNGDKHTLSLYYVEDSAVTIEYVSEDTIKGTVSRASDSIQPVTGTIPEAVTAKPSTGYEFDHWSLDTNDAYTNASSALAPLKGDALVESVAATIWTARTYTAHFKKAPAQVQITVTKNWVDAVETTHGPVSITIERKNDAGEWETFEAETGTTYAASAQSFAETATYTLPKYGYKADGTAYEYDYRVTETEVDGYTTQYQVGTQVSAAPIALTDDSNSVLINNVIAETNDGSITVKKIWDDEEDTSRRSAVAVELTNNSVEKYASQTKSIAVPASGNSNTVDFENLPVYTYTVEDGLTTAAAKIVYTIDELLTTEQEALYTKSIADDNATADEGATLEIVNSRILDTMSVTKTATDDTFGNVLSELVFAIEVYDESNKKVGDTLYLENGETKQLTKDGAAVNVAVGATYKTKEIGVYKIVNGERVAQDVTLPLEAWNVVEGDVTITAGGENTATVTNTRKTANGDGTVEVTKLWSGVDANVDKPSVTLELWKKSGAAKLGDAYTVKLDDTDESGYKNSNTWKYTFGNAEGTKLPAFELNGDAITYVVYETEIPNGYGSTDNDKADLSVTNTYDGLGVDGETITVTVTKKWVDADGNDLVIANLPEGTAPMDLPVTLTREDDADLNSGNAEQTITAKMSAEGNTTLTWSGLYAYDMSGNPITYTATETLSGDNYTAVTSEASVTYGDASYAMELKNQKTSEDSVVTKTDAETAKITVTSDGKEVAMVKPGDTVTYTIVAKNNQNSKQNITVTDTLPKGMTFVSAEAEDADTDPVAKNEDGTTTLTWTYKDVPAFESRTITVNAKVDEWDEKDAETSVNPQPDGNPVYTNSVTMNVGSETRNDSVSTTIYNAKIDVEKVVKSGTEVEFEITVENVGNVDLTDVEMHEVDFIVNKGEADAASKLAALTGDKTATIGALAVGDKKTFTVAYTMEAKDLNVENTVSASGKGQQNDTVSDEDTETYSRTAGELTITKTVSGLEGKTESTGFARIADAFKVTVKNSSDQTVMELPNSIYKFTVSDKTASVTVPLPQGTYTVEESGYEVTGYDVTEKINGTEATSEEITVGATEATAAFVNTYARKTVAGREITVQKTWNDTNDQSQLRPESFYVTLTGDNVTHTVDSWTKNGNVWTATVSGTVYTYTVDGEKITYAVDELVAEADKKNFAKYTEDAGNTASIIPADGEKSVTLSNTLTSAKLTINKTVEDSTEDSEFDKLYFGFQLKNEAGKDVVGADGKAKIWTSKTGEPVDIDGLAKGDTYTVIEVGVYTDKAATTKKSESALNAWDTFFGEEATADADRTTTVELKDEENTLNVTNKRITSSETDPITFSKTWNDGSNKYGRRPTQTAFHALLTLKQDSTDQDSTDITNDANVNAHTYSEDEANTASSWTIKFTNLPLYSLNGVKYEYTLTETLGDLSSWYTATTGSATASVDKKTAEALVNDILTIDNEGEDAGLTITKEVTGTDAATAAAADTYTIAVTLPSEPTYSLNEAADRAVTVVTTQPAHVTPSLDGNVVTFTGVKNGDELKVTGDLPVGSYSVAEPVNSQNKFTYTTTYSAAKKGAALAAGTEVELEANENGQFKVTNEVVANKTITVNKTWDDKGAVLTEQPRPEVTYQLYYGNTTTPVKDASGNAQDITLPTDINETELSVAFQGVPAYADGYTVKETIGTDEYGYEITSEGWTDNKKAIGADETSVDVINTRTKAIITVTKEIVDETDDLEAGMASKFVFGIGEEKNTAIGHTESTTFEVTIGEEYTLTEYLADGTTAPTNVWETKFDGTVDADAAMTFTPTAATKTINVTNRRKAYNPPNDDDTNGSVGARKVWQYANGDEIEEAALKPEVTVNLVQKDQNGNTVNDKYETKVLNSGNSWTDIFTQLPAASLDGTKLYTYDVEEVVPTVAGMTYVKSESYATEDGVYTTIITNTAQEITPENPVKTANKTAVQPGDVVEYTITRKNYLANPANVTITDTLKKGLTYVTEGDKANTQSVSVTVGETKITTIEPTFTPNGSELKWELTDVPPMAVITVTFTATVNKDAITVDSITNNATVDLGHEDDSDMKDTDPEKDPTLDTPKLTIQKAQSTDVVRPSVEDDPFTFTYTLTVTNDKGTAKATGVVVTDTLPNGVTYTGEVENVSAEGQVVTWNVGDLEPKQTATVTFTVQVAEDADLGAINTLTNKAMISMVNNETTDVTSNEVTANIARIATTKDVNKTADVEQGETLTYTITVENTGNVELTDVKLDDPMFADGQTVADSFTVDEGEITVVGEVATLGTLAIGATKTVTFQYTVDSDDIVATKIINTVTATADDPTDTEDKVLSAEATAEATTEAAAPAISVTKTVIDEQDYYKVGDTVNYEVTVKNTGNVTVRNINVTDTMDGGRTATLVSSSSNVIASLAPGATDSVRYSYTIVESDLGANGVTTTIGNIASATGTPDSGTTPSDSDTEEINVAAELTIVKKGEGNDELKDVTFQLLSGSTVVDTKTTDADGKVKFLNLVPGTYTLKETETNLGYALIADQTVEIVSGENKATVGGENVTGPFEITNALDDDPNTNQFTLSKELAVADPDGVTGPFYFEVTLTHPNIDNFSATVGTENETSTERVISLTGENRLELHADESIVIKGMPVGTEISVAEVFDGEADKAWKTPVYTAESVTIAADARVQSITVTNERVLYGTDGDGELTVKKSWKNQYGTDLDDALIPASIDVKLYRNGEAYTDETTAVKTLKSDNDWRATYENLPKFDLTGKPYEYTIKEVVGTDEFVKGDEPVIENHTYVVDITGEGTDNVTVTNTLQDDEANKPEKTADSASIDGVKIGDTIEYTVTHTSNKAAEGTTVLTDKLPVGMTFEGTTSITVTDADKANEVNPTVTPVVSKPDENNQITVTWTIPNVPAMGHVTLVFKAKVTEATFEAVKKGSNSEISNTIKADLTDDSKGETTSDAATVPVSHIDIVKTYQIIPGDAHQGIEGKASLGDTINYTITVTNDGGSDLTGVTVTDTMFDGEKVTSVTVKNGETESAETPADGKVSVGDLEAGDSATVTYSYVVTEQDILNANIHNAAGVTAKDPDEDDIEDDTDVDVPTDGMNGLLKITKVIDDQTDDKENGEKQKFTFQLKYGEEIIKVDGQETFTLGKDEFKTIEKLGIGLTYTISEIEAADGETKLNAWNTTVDNAEGLTTTTNVVIAAQIDETEPANAVTFTNTRKELGEDPENPKDTDGTLTVTKLWRDSTGEIDLVKTDNKVVPESISIQLKRSDVDHGDEQTLSGDAWTHTFDKLALTDLDGNPYTYEVEEVGIDKDGKVTYGDYTFTVTKTDADYTDNTFEITNTLDNNEAKNPTKTAEEEKKDKDGNDDGVEIGDIITYTISRTSHLATKASVTVTDTLPAGIDFVEGTSVVMVDGNEITVTPTYENDVLTWTFDVPAMAQIDISFNAVVTKEAIKNPTIENKDVVFDLGDKDDAAMTPENPEVVDVLQPNLKIEKTDEGKGVRPCQAFAYTITVSNAAEDRRTGRAEDLKVTDTLPSQVVFVSTEVSDSTTTATYDEATGTVTWLIPAIEGTLLGAEPTIMTLTINVTVKDELPEDDAEAKAENYLTEGDKFIENSATLYYDNDPTKPDDDKKEDSSTEETCIARAKVEKTATIIRSTDPKHPDMDGDLSTVALGDTIRYAVKVTNNGGCTLHDLVVYDEMIAKAVEGTVYPPELVETVASQTRDIEEIDGIKVLKVDVLESGYSVTFTYDYVVTEADILNGSVYNKATAVAKGPQGEDAFGDDETTTTTDKPAPAMKVTKEVVSTKETYKIGEKVEYLITIENTGNVTLTDIKVDDTLYSDLYKDEPLYELLTPEKTSIAPGETTTATYTYEVQSGDVLPTYEEDGSIRKHMINNVATAVATPVAGEPNPVTASDNAEAEAKHTVLIRFICSLEGTILKYIEVPYGGSTTPPDFPRHYGYDFIGWDGGIWENVFSNQNIFAMFEKRPGWYTDYNEDLTILDADIPLAGGYISNVGDCFD